MWKVTLSWGFRLDMATVRGEMMFPGKATLVIWDTKSKDKASER